MGPLVGTRPRQDDHGMAEQRDAPPTGALVVDGRSDRVGIVMGHEGPNLQLRPLRGGREWDCPPDSVRPAGVADELRAKMQRMNADRGQTR